LKKISILAIFTILVCIISPAKTLQNIQKRGYLKCGVQAGLSGLSDIDNKNKWSGLYIDYCRAIAAGVLGDAKKVKFIKIHPITKFKDLDAGIIDILSTNISLGLEIDVSQNINFGGIIYYGGQGFLTRKKLNINNAKQLNNASICLNSKANIGFLIDDYFLKYKIKYKKISYRSANKAKLGFIKGKCDVLVDTRYNLYRLKSKLKNSSKYKILPQIIVKEPKGAIIKHKDDEWLNIVRWTLFALIEAEELGITKKNIDSKNSSTDLYARIFLGKQNNRGKNIHLKNNWAYNIIKQVGNYGEIFERNLGANSNLKMNRGYNNLWSKGGLMYSMP